MFLEFPKADCERTIGDSVLINPKLVSRVIKITENISRIYIVEGNYPTPIDIAEPISKVRLALDRSLVHQDS